MSRSSTARHPIPSVLRPDARIERKEQPFPHLVIDEVFTDEFYAALVGELQDKIARGLSETFSREHFSRFPHYDAYSLALNPKDPGAPSHFLFSREWQSYVNGFFRLGLDENTLLEAHYHLTGSQDGYVHTDYQVAHFAKDPFPGTLNGWFHQVPYRGGNGPLRGVRSLALIFYLGNLPWKEEDGGETALFDGPDVTRGPAKLVAPLNNRLLAFEVSPHSFHAFRSNRRNPRTSLAQWFHSPEATVKKRYGSEADKGNALKKNVLFVGSTGALGRGFIERFSKRYRVAGVATRKPAEVKYPFIQGDIATDAERIADEALRELGTVDLLVNAAVRYEHKPLLEYRHEEMVRQLETNVLAPLELAAALVRKAWGTDRDQNLAMNRSIVNVSSIASIHVYQGGKGLYGAAKAALNTLTAYMAEEFRQYGIRVNAVAPNSFPDLVPTEQVLDAIAEFDHSSTTGVVRVLGER